MEYEVVHTTTPTSTGIQTVSLSGLSSLAIDAVIVIISGATTNGTPADHIRMNVGVAANQDGSGLAQGCSYIRAEDAVTDDNATGYGDDGSVVRIVETAGNSLEGEAVLDALGTGEVDLDWISAPLAAYRMTVIAFAGTDVRAYVNQDLSTIAGNDVTEPDFNGRLWFFVSNEGSTAAEQQGGAFGANGGLLLGACLNDGTQRSAGILASGENGSTQVTNANAQNNHSIQYMTRLDNTSLWRHLDSSDFDAAGATHTTTVDNFPSPTTIPMSYTYLALDFDSGQGVDLGTITSPTTTGVASLTPGFETGLLMTAMTFCDTENVQENSSPAGEGFCFGAYDGTTESSQGVAGDSDITTHQNNSHSSDANIIDVYTGGTTLDLQASVDAIDSTDVDLDWTTVDASARYGFYIAIEVPPAGGVDAELAGYARGAGDVVGDLDVIIPLAGYARGSGEVVGDLDVVILLEGYARGGGETVGDLFRNPLLSGFVRGAGETVGDLTVIIPLDGFVRGVGEVVGDATIGADAELAGVARGAGEAVGDLTVIVPLEGVARGTGETIAVLLRNPLLSGFARGEGDVVGDLTVTQAVLEGVARGDGTVVGDLTVIIPLEGAVRGTGEVVGSIVRSILLTGDVRGSGETVGDLITTGAGGETVDTTEVTRYVQGRLNRGSDPRPLFEPYVFSGTEGAFTTIRILPLWENEQVITLVAAFDQLGAAGTMDLGTPDNLTAFMEDVPVDSAGTVVMAPNVGARAVPSNTYLVATFSSGFSAIAGAVLRVSGMVMRPHGRPTSGELFS